MPNNTNKKDSKGKNSTAKKATNTKKVVTKADEKKTTTKKVETKVTEKNNKEKKVETKPVEVKEVKVIKDEKNVKKENSSNNSIMNNTPFIIALCIIVILIALLIFVKLSKRVPKISKGNEVVASIKGKKITSNDLYNSLKDDYGTNTLINLIDSYITEKEVKEITDKDKEYVQGVVDYYKQYAEYYKMDLEEFLESYAGISGMTSEKKFYDFVLEDYKKTIAVRNYVANEAKEEELKKYYEENYFDKLTVKHILIEVDSSAEDSEKASKEAYDTAVKLIKKLDKISDADELNKKFDELAKEYSDDTQTYSNGGLMEDLSKKDIQESFWNAAEKLKDGKYTKEPVKTTYGYHIILKVSSTPVEKYEDIKDDVKIDYAESLLNDNSNLQITKWDELRRKYKLSIKDDIIKDEYDKTVKDAKDNKDSNEDEKTQN